MSAVHFCQNIFLIDNMPGRHRPENARKSLPIQFQDFERPRLGDRWLSFRGAKNVLGSR
jgi:hypothetical protein